MFLPIMLIYWLSFTGIILFPWFFFAKKWSKVVRGIYIALFIAAQILCITWVSTSSIVPLP